MRKLILLLWMAVVVAVLASCEKPQRNGKNVIMGRTTSSKGELLEQFSYYNGRDGSIVLHGEREVYSPFQPRITWQEEYEDGVRVKGPTIRIVISDPKEALSTGASGSGSAAPPKSGTRADLERLR